MAAYMRTVFHLQRCLSRPLASTGCVSRPLCRYTSSNTEKKPDGSDTSDEISISDSCIKQLHKLEEKNKFLRVTVEGGGCSGFQCIFNLDSTLNEKEDRIFEKEGAKVVIDEITLSFIKGATIDYHQELIRSAFRVTDIPSADKGCSCGASFSLKI